MLVFKKTAQCAEYIFVIFPFKMLDATKMLFEAAKETPMQIDVNHMILTIGGIPVVYCEKKDSFNATLLCKEVSSTMTIDKWFSGQQSATYAERFPNFTYTHRKNSKDDSRVCGQYIHRRLFMRILSWANDQVAFDLENGIPYEHIRDHRGYIYAVQPKEHIGTGIYKAGRTWRLEQRMTAYGKGTEVHKTRKVLDMIDTEKVLLNALDIDSEHFTKTRIGDEYYDCKKDDMLKVFETIVQEINPDQDVTPYITLLFEPPSKGSRLAKSGRWKLVCELPIAVKA
jgi:ribosomal protein L17